MQLDGSTRRRLLLDIPIAEAAAVEAVAEEDEEDEAAGRLFEQRESTTTPGCSIVYSPELLSFNAMRM